MSDPAGMLIVAAALAALAVLLDPRSWRRDGGVGSRVRGRDGPAVLPGVATSRGGVSRRRGRRWARRGRQEAGPPLGVLCTQVASRLRSGAGVSQAWRGALEGTSGVEGDADAGTAATEAMEVDGDGIPLQLRSRVGESAAADAVVVACRLALRCGTPLAEILDECAQGITEVEAAHADRRRALAGPAATARLLIWLPAASLLLGAALGADPLEAVVRGGPTALAMLLGAGFLLVGRWWIRRLVRAAETAGGGWGP